MLLLVTSAVLDTYVGCVTRGSHWSRNSHSFYQFQVIFSMEGFYAIDLHVQGIMIALTLTHVCCSDLSTLFKELHEDDISDLEVLFPMSIYNWEP